MSKKYNDPFHSVNYNAIIDGTRTWGVKSGLAVSERGAGQNMSVDVAAGTALINSIEYIETSIVNIVISAAHATLPRRDIIIYDVATTTPIVITGIAATEPIPPDITNGDILLAIVNIAAADTTIANTDIEDGRVNVIIPTHAALHMEGSTDVITYYNRFMDDDLYDNSTSRSVTAGSYTKYKEIKIDDCNSIIKFSFYISAGIGTGLYAKIYKNGVAVGTERLVSNTSGTFTEDIAGWTAGDLAQIYCWRSGAGTCSVKDFKIKGANIILAYPPTGFTSQDP